MDERTRASLDGDDAAMSSDILSDCFVEADAERQYQGEDDGFFDAGEDGDEDT